MGEPAVTIVILNWNGVEDTIECVESLKKVTYPDYNIAVVDNGSSGNDVEILKAKFGDYIDIIENGKNLGFPEGCNVGIRYALENGADYILLLNNDTVVDPDFLSELVRMAESDPSIGIIGPKTYFYDEPNLLQFTWARIDLWRGMIFQPGANETDTGQCDEVHEADYVQGSCFLIKRAVTENIGLMDPRYFSHWDECDYCMRAKRAGFRLVYLPQAKIWHKLARSGGKITGWFQYWNTRNCFLFMKKYATRWQIVTFTLWFFGLTFWYRSAVYLLYYRNVKVLRYFYRGILHGLMMPAVPSGKGRGAREYGFSD